MTALFVVSLLEDGSKRPQTRVLKWTLSLAAHGTLVAAMAVGPLCWIDRIEVHPSNYTQLVATTAELMSDALVTAAPKNVAAATTKLLAPMPSPSQVGASRRQTGETDAGAEMAPDAAGTITAAVQIPLPHGLLETAASLSTYPARICRCL